MSKTGRFEKHPDECNHPEEQIENVADIRGGSVRPRCSTCGFRFICIGTHERVIIHGDYIEDANYECVICGKTAISAGNMTLKTCTN